MAKKEPVIKVQELDRLYDEVRHIIEQGRNTVYRAANAAMVHSYWQIGKLIVEEEQKGEERAEYGIALIKGLAFRLSSDYGKGFTETNLKYMRQFYNHFGNGHALRDELSWTHYRLLLKVEKETARTFYVSEAVSGNWSTRTLERQINSHYYERMLLSSKED